MRNERINLIIGFISVFCILINVSTIYSYYFTEISNTALVIGALGCILILFLNISKVRLYKETLYFVLIWFAALLIPSFFSEFSISLLWYSIKFMIVLIDTLCLMINGIKITNILFKCSTVFMIWAILNYIVMSTIGNSLPVSRVYMTDWGTPWFLRFMIFFNNTSGINIQGNEFLRMHVPFSEPGNAQMYFNFGLLYILFSKDEIKCRKLLKILFILSILLTISMTAYIILGILLFVYLIQNKKRILYIPTIIIIVSLLYIITRNKLNSVSYSDRSANMIYIFNTAKEFFPFGSGYGNIKAGEEVLLSSGKTTTTGMYCGLLSPIAILGIFSIVFYLLLFISIKFFDSNNKCLCFSIGVLIIFTLFTEPQSFSIFTMIFLINGIINYSRIKNQKYCYPRDSFIKMTFETKEVN